MLSEQASQRTKYWSTRVLSVSQLECTGDYALEAGFSAVFAQRY